MTEQEAVPAGIDPSIPSVARMYDYYLGGKDNFASDREAAEQFIRIVPGIREMARDNRAFLSRAVELLARQGVRQFLDIGSGLPTRDNVHQVAQRVAPESRVVYVDNDPIVLVHGRALLEDNAFTSVVQADMREPEKLLTHPQVESAIDFTRPVAVLMVSMLHFIPDDALVARIMSEIRQRLVPGGHLVITHAFEAEVSAEVREAGQKVYRSTSAGALTSRGPEQLAELLSGMDLLEPGVVPVEAWRPEYDEDVTVDFTKPGILGVVGRL
ncbi:SAM-dependent methyltransferase [Streptosporangium sp. NBC_01495]|uniref:SAM-dependent methyltransferase n=1 Tax=Streptosporangium sp. NBC_01495 TaxID=2903899 RepID=UPI002E357C92|nr:SAM-dependent methyltransferase [Streptosporangium sp. NBC_01495]